MDHETASPQIMLPKYRYDEVNHRYRQTKQALEQTKALAYQRGEEIRRLQEQIKKLRAAYDHALIDLEVKETFVEGGLTKKQYEAIIPKMTCRDEEKKALAEAIVQLIQEQRKER